MKEQIQKAVEFSDITTKEMNDKIALAIENYKKAYKEAADLTRDMGIVIPPTDTYQSSNLAKFLEKELGFNLFLDSSYIHFYSTGRTVSRYNIFQFMITTFGFFHKYTERKSCVSFNRSLECFCYGEHSYDLRLAKEYGNGRRDYEKNDELMSLIKSVDTITENMKREFEA